MAQIIVYKRDTGNIINQWDGHPNDQDELTAARQEEMLVKMYPAIFYEVGMIVDEGDNAVFVPDYIELDDKKQKKIKASKLSKVNKNQRTKPND